MHVHVPCVWYLSDLVIQQMKLQSEDKDGSEVMAEMDKLKPQVVDMATKTKKTSPKQEEEKWKNNKQEFENVIE